MSFSFLCVLCHLIIYERLSTNPSRGIQAGWAVSALHRLEMRRANRVSRNTTTHKKTAAPKVSAVRSGAESRTRTCALMITNHLPSLLGDFGISRRLFTLYALFMHYSKYFLGDFSYFCAYSCVLFYIFQKILRLSFLVRPFYWGFIREKLTPHHTLYRPPPTDGDTVLLTRTCSAGEAIRFTLLLFFFLALPFLCAGGGGDARRGVNCTLNAYYGNS